jgi:hypothetical protein
MKLGDRKGCCLFPEFPVTNITISDDRYYTVTLMPVGLQFYDWLPPPGNMFILLHFLLLIFYIGKRKIVVTEIHMQSELSMFILHNSKRGCLTFTVYVYITTAELATCWTVRGSNPGSGEFFHTCPDRPWGPPSLLYNGYWVFPGVKERPGRDADPSPTSSAVGHERVELYLYSPYGPYSLYRASVPVQ